MIYAAVKQGRKLHINFSHISKCCTFVHGFPEAQASKAICTLVRFKLKFYTGEMK